jgi:hypothetical protein
MNSQLQAFLEQLPESTGQNAGAVAPAANVRQSYARYETVSRSGGKVSACFSDTFSGACNSTTYSSIEAGAIIDQQGAGACSSGRAVHAFTWF